MVFLAVDGTFSKEFAKAISEGKDGATVIDNSSAFRMDPDVPLVIPEINIKVRRWCYILYFCLLSQLTTIVWFVQQLAKGKKLIANPNCTTAVGLMALWPLHKRFRLKKCIMSTYQVKYGVNSRCLSPSLIQSMQPPKSVRVANFNPSYNRHLPVLEQLECKNFWTKPRSEQQPPLLSPFPWHPNAFFKNHPT